MVAPSDGYCDTATWVWMMVLRSLLAHHPMQVFAFWRKVWPGNLTSISTLKLRLHEALAVFSILLALGLAALGIALFYALCQPELHIWPMFRLIVVGLLIAPTLGDALVALKIPASMRRKEAIPRAILVAHSSRRMRSDVDTVGDGPVCH